MAEDLKVQLVNQLLGLEGELKKENPLYTRLVEITGEIPGEEEKDLKFFFLARLLVSKEEILKEGISKEQLDYLVEEYEKHLKNVSVEQIKTEIKEGTIYVQNLVRQAEIRKANLEEFTKAEKEKTKEQIIRVIPQEQKEIYQKISDEVLNETQPIEEIKKEAQEKIGKIDTVEELVERAKIIRTKRESYKKATEEAQELAKELAVSETVETKLEQELGKTIYESITEDGIVDKQILEEKILQTIRENSPLGISDDLKTKTEITAAKSASKTNSFIEQNQELIKTIRGNEIEKKILDDLWQSQINGEITLEQYKEIAPAYADLIQKFATKGANTAQFKTEVTKGLSQQMSPGQIENLFSDATVMTRIASMSPKELQNFIRTYREYHRRLNGRISNYKIAISLEKILSYESKNQSDFYRQIRYFQQLFGLKFAGENIIGLNNESLRKLLQGSFNLFKNGFNIAGIKSFFAKSAAGIGIKGALATTPWGAVLVVAKSLLSKLGSGVKDFLRAAGLNITDGLKKFLGETFGIVGSFAGSFVQMAEDTFNGAITLIGAVLVLVFAGFFLMGCQNSEIASSFIPTFGIQNNFITGDYTPPGEETPTSCKENYTGVIKTYKSGDLTLYVFEAGSIGERMNQKYDLGKVDAKQLGTIDGFELDKRVIEAYVSMRRAFETVYPNSNDLTLTSGYRSTTKQLGLYNDKYQENVTLFNSGQCPGGCSDICGNKTMNVSVQIQTCTRRFVAAPGCSPHHTGRAIDILVNGSAGDSSVYSQQRLSKTFQWLTNNAAKYGFYNYVNEPWHWEYNPPDLNQ